MQGQYTTVILLVSTKNNVKFKKRVNAIMIKLKNDNNMSIDGGVVGTVELDQESSKCYQKPHLSFIVALWMNGGCKNFLETIVPNSRRNVFVLQNFASIRYSIMPKVIFPKILSTFPTVCLLHYHKLFAFDIDLTNR